VSGTGFMNRSRTMSKIHLPASWAEVIQSVRFRLTLWFVAILALILALFGGFVYTLQKRDLNRATLDRLANEIRQIQSSDRFADREIFEPRVAIPNPSQDANPSLRADEVLALTDPTGVVVQRYGPIADEDLSRIANLGAALGPSGGYFDSTLRPPAVGSQGSSGQYAFLAAPLTIGTSLVGYLILGTPVDPAGQLHRLLLTLLAGGLGTVLLALGGGYWLADRSFRPVVAITEAARQISESDLSRRLNLGRHDELGRLAGTFDQMLARLQAAFERQRQFTADASHELRTPLTIVDLEAHRALAAVRSPEEYRRALTVIQSENAYMAALVNDLLTLSRMDAGRLAMDVEEVDLGDLAAEVVERLTPLARRTSVELSTGELPELIAKGDRRYLMQALTNLVENAIKYVRAPVKRVRLELRTMQEGDRVIGSVSVEDNGPGIPTEHLPRLFDRFYQIDQARSRNPEPPEDPSGEDSGTSGAGLGLSIVQAIVQAHGGTIVVSSDVGKGTRFELRLPVLTPQMA
jgi:signal transduction histidine kinase